MQRAAIALLAWVLLLVVPVVGADVAAASAIPDGQQPGHAVDVNSSGTLVMAAVKDSGRLYTRTRTDNRWSGWQVQGRDTWVSADVAIDNAGNIALIGLKQSGALWTRDWTPASGWGSWSKQGRSTWSTSAVPSIDSAAGFTEFAAVKASGALYTRSRTAGAQVCPAGYAPDQSLGGICARFEPASQNAASCPTGSRGSAGDCYIVVAKGPGVSTCAAGALVGNSCVITGNPPSPGPGGSLACEAGFGLIDGECVKYADPIREAAECPQGSLEHEDGGCRKAVNDAVGSYFCEDASAALNGGSCVFTAAFEDACSPDNGGCRWSSWVEHGRRTWAQADITVFDGDFSVLAGTKRDGRLYTRIVGPTRGGWQEHGLPTWSTDTAPSISMYSNALTLGAVKADGRAYVRTGTYASAGAVFDDQWNSFRRAIETNAAGIAVATTGTATATVAVTTTSGELRVQYQPDGPTGKPTFLGFSGWSSSVAPSLAYGGPGVAGTAVMATSEDGSLSIFRRRQGERFLTTLGRSTWAAGPDTNLPAVERSSYEAGLHIVGANGIPAGRYRIEAGVNCFWFSYSTIDETEFLGNQKGGGGWDGQDPGVPRRITIDIELSDGAFEFRSAGGGDCGRLYPYVPAASPVSTFGEGHYVVGDDIAPGRYAAQTTIGARDCTWTKVSSFAGTPDAALAFEYSTRGQQMVVDVSPSLAGFAVSGSCEFSPYMAPAAPATAVGPGMYVVGSDLAPGRYELTPGGCSYGRFSGFEGRTYFSGNYIGVLGGRPGVVFGEEPAPLIIDVKSTDAGFALGYVPEYDCQLTAYMPSSVLVDAPKPGSNVVGIDIEPGTYQATGADPSICSWYRVSGFGWSAAEVIERGMDGVIEVTIEAGDVGFHAQSWCGEWVRVE